MHRRKAQEAANEFKRTSDERSLPFSTLVPFSGAWPWSQTKWEGVGVAGGEESVLAGCRATGVHAARKKDKWTPFH
jgi:hypothetical protein